MSARKPEAFYNQCLLSLLVDITNKNIHPKGVNILFLTEPPHVTTTNKLSDVPDDIFNIFTDKSGRAALVTKGIISWRCPQYCAKDIIVCVPGKYVP